MSGIIIAIDGYSGCGKSSSAKFLAKRFGYTCIDSGAMYRAVTYKFHKWEVSRDNDESIKRALSRLHLHFQPSKDGGYHIFHKNEDLEPYLRTMEVNNMVSRVSAQPIIREKMVEMQQSYGKKGGIVIEGRDIGTVVFPKAEVKFFLTASMAVRARRRQLQLKEKGQEVSTEEILRNFKQRDEIDSTRTTSPLKKAEGAITIDTSNLTFEDQINKMAGIAEGVIHGN